MGIKRVQHNMDLPVELNNVRRTATVIFAGQHDFAFLAEWRAKVGEDKNLLRNDSLEFAALAVHRFQAHSAIQPYAEIIEDIGDHIQGNPNCEVGGCVLLTSDWFSDSKVLGLAHFRRSWSNNIVLDYLTAHPFITRPPVGYQEIIRGVGRALLYFMSTIAKRYDCGYIWGEATPTSCTYYKKLFALDPVEDMILIPRANFLKFIDRFDSEDKTEEGAMPIKNEALQEIYALEAKDSPIVGSKTAVFNPKRRLAHHFLDLPYHLQITIAVDLGLLESDDQSQPASEQFRRFFQRATEKKILADLWREVEKRHPDGEQDKNPFPES